MSTTASKHACTTNAVPGVPVRDRWNTTVKHSMERQTPSCFLNVNSNINNSGVIPLIDHHLTKGMIGLSPLVEELADHSFEIQSRILLGELRTKKRDSLRRAWQRWRERVSPCTQDIWICIKLWAIIICCFGMACFIAEYCKRTRARFKRFEKSKAPK